VSDASTTLALLAEDTIPGWIIKAALIFFFIGLPILRGIKETLAKKKEFAEQRRQARDLGSAPAGEVEDLDEAKRRFEALLRGEEPAPRAAPTPPPPPPVPRPTMAEAPPPAQLAGRLSDLPDAPSEDEAEAAATRETADTEHFVVDEETKAREELDRRLRDERDSRTEFLRRERESGAGRRLNVAADEMTSLGAPTAAATIQRAQRPEVLFTALADAKARRAALRRAIIASEVLGAPAALRGPDSGPAGLRQSA